MLTTQYNGTNGFGGLGALVSSAATADLQRYLASIGRLSSASVTGVMNDATMAVIYSMLVQTAATVGQISALPQNIRDGINKVTNALKDADNKIRSISFGQATLSSVFSNWATINAGVRAISPSAADSLAAAREAVYNAVAGYAGTILSAVRIFFPSGVGAMPSTQLLWQAIQPVYATMTPATGTYPAGTIYAYSSKRGMYRIAVPRTAGSGLGIEVGLLGNCVFGECGLGAAATMTEVASSPTPPPNGTPTTEAELERLTGTLPFYKKWQFWTAVGGGAAVIGTGTAFYLHRRKKVA